MLCIPQQFQVKYPGEKIEILVKIFENFVKNNLPNNFSDLWWYGYVEIDFSFTIRA